MNSLSLGVMVKPHVLGPLKTNKPCTQYFSLKTVHFINDVWQLIWFLQENTKVEIYVILFNLIF